ncbi:HD domain-containing protein [Lachnospiraceae bacterium]|nr:HD domain-containing protein [Ruminococcus sp.]NBI57533.1 HD domain-containing protein [Lachnospiraceae bacterium]
MHYMSARKIFESYLNSYDRTDDKVRLKIVHTYGVVGQAANIARRMRLSNEDTELAKLIALLHDLGRFEQLQRFDSFEPDTMDHAAYGVQVLFEEGMIRKFLPESTWDPIIRTAIAKHSDYSLSGAADARTQLHARLIRDADKLDNCRVKLTDATETFLGASPEEIGAQEISPAIYDTIFRNQCILSADRKTLMDYWVSYIAYFFDINFRESMDIIVENDFISRIVRRIPYSNPKTAEQMNDIENYVKNYAESM